MRRLSCKTSSRIATGSVLTMVTQGSIVDRLKVVSAKSEGENPQETLAERQTLFQLLLKPDANLVVCTRGDSGSLMR